MSFAHDSNDDREAHQLQNSARCADSGENVSSDSAAVPKRKKAQVGNNARYCTLCNYSATVTAVILGMVLTGAVRSVGVKTYFQIGFESPLFVTMLYLAGAFLCIIPYGIAVAIERYYKNEWTIEEPGTKPGDDVQDLWQSQDAAHIGSASTGGRPVIFEEEKEEIKGDEDETYQRKSSRQFSSHAVALSPSAGSHISLVSLALSNKSSQFIDEFMNGTDDEQRTKSQLSDRASSRQRSERSLQEQNAWAGSTTGLTRESEKQVSRWVDRVPTYAKPILPGLCNVVKSFLRWASLIYVSASVAEILISGLELVLVVLAARIVRKRMVTKVRWLGVAIVCVGIVMVGCTDVFGSSENGNSNDEEKSTGIDQLIGIVLIVGQCLVSVVQDILEEVFVQVGDFPALLLVAVEGFVGMVVGLAIYYPASKILNDDPQETWDTLTESPGKIGFVVGLTLLFMVTSVFNILACAATSSMTRNMWGNLRTALVWVFGLIIFYSSGDDDIGEPWEIPASFIILFGFGVILFGIQVYYREKSSGVESSGENSHCAEAPSENKGDVSVRPSAAEPQTAME